MGLELGDGGACGCVDGAELDLVIVIAQLQAFALEAGAKLVPEAVMAEAILFGHRALQPIVTLQEEIQKAVGKAKRIVDLRRRE